MQVTETVIPGAFVVTPEKFRDERGCFFESIRSDLLEPHLGYFFRAEQINYSVSRKHTLRGIHSVTVPPGQAKFVTCIRGAIRDIIVDLRIGSPTFGRHVASELDPESGRAVYVPVGVGHAFLALADDTCVSYAVSSLYVPGTQIEIDPLDDSLRLPWNLTAPPVMSTKDRQAPLLVNAVKRGLLSSWVTA